MFIFVDLLLFLSLTKLPVYFAHSFDKMTERLSLFQQDFKKSFRNERGLKAIGTDIFPHIFLPSRRSYFICLFLIALLQLSIFDRLKSEILLSLLFSDALLSVEKKMCNSLLERQFNWRGMCISPCEAKDGDEIIK